MKLKLKAIHKSFQEGEQPGFGGPTKIHAESFAVFQDEEGSAVKLCLTLDDLKTIKIGTTYDFNLSYEPSANLILPKAAAEEDSKPIC